METRYDTTELTAPPRLTPPALIPERDTPDGPVTTQRMRRTVFGYLALAVAGTAIAGRAADRRAANLGVGMIAPGAGVERRAAGTCAIRARPCPATGRRVRRLRQDRTIPALLDSLSGRVQRLRPDHRSIRSHAGIPRLFVFGTTQYHCQVAGADLLGALVERTHVGSSALRTRSPSPGRPHGVSVA